MASHGLQSDAAAAMPEAEPPSLAELPGLQEFYRLR